MELLKSWGTTVCIAAIAAGIAGIIAPSGKMEKVYKFAVSLFFLCCLLVPLFSLKNITLDSTAQNSTNINQTTGASNRELASTVSEQAASAAQQNISGLVENCCRSCGVIPVRINVKVAFDCGGSKMSVSSAEIILKSSDMSKQTNITDTIKNKLGIDVKIKEGGK